MQLNIRSTHYLAHSSNELHDNLSVEASPDEEAFGRSCGPSFSKTLFKQFLPWKVQMNAQKFAFGRPFIAEHRTVEKVVMISN